MFEAVHRRSISLKTFNLQFRLGLFRLTDDEVPVGNSGRIAAQRRSERWLECDSIRSPGRLILPWRKEAAINKYQAARSTILERPCRQCELMLAGLTGSNPRNCIAPKRSDLVTIPRDSRIAGTMPSAYNVIQ